MRVSESSGDFVGRLWTVSDGNQPTLSSLLSTDSSVWAPVHHIPFSEPTPRRIETKRPHILFMCQKCGEKEGRKEGAGRITLSVGWYHSIHADQFSQTEGDEKGASTRLREGGREGRRAEMVVVLICQRNTALSVLLKRPHKPELSEVGGHTLTFGHADIDCGFSAWLSSTQSYPSTSRGSPARSKPCFVAYCASNSPQSSALNFLNLPHWPIT